MKKYLAIILFFALSLRPMYYLGQVAYYELNIDYIIKTYCVNTDKPELKCNGKCHLSKQLQIDSNSSDNKGVNNTAVVEGFFPIFNHCVSYESLKGPKYFIFNTVVDNYSDNYFYLTNFFFFKPPRV